VSVASLEVGGDAFIAFRNIEQFVFLKNLNLFFIKN
jgi:hypothetical protein